MDFRSDTITVPTQEMRAAMFAVEVGDDVYGEDKTTTELENKLANMFGMEAGAFFPSGTMANQVAIRTHVKPGDDVLCSDVSHIYHYEGGGVALNAGANIRLLKGENGIFTPETLLANILPDDIHFPNPKLVVLENTTNKGGGKAWDLKQIEAISKTARKSGLLMHLDGARIFNAIIAKGYSTTDIGVNFDSISICLSKGLGCPVGSVLIGSKRFIHQVRRNRKSMGGGMRQTGFLAAAGIFALENNVDRLTLDHARAVELYNAAMKSPWVKSAIEPETNILLIETHDKAGEVISELNKKGVKCSSMGENIVRFVTHLQITDSDIQSLKSFLENSLD